MNMFEIYIFEVSYAMYNPRVPYFVSRFFTISFAVEINFLSILFHNTKQ